MGKRYASLIPQSDSLGKAQRKNDRKRICQTKSADRESIRTALETEGRRSGQKLAGRYRERRASLFVFLYRADVPAHNNACERALRPSVIHRKVMGSFRSDWGAQGYAALVTVLNTAKRNGQSAFQKLLQLTGKPVLPFLNRASFA